MPLFLYPLLKWIGGFFTGPLLQGALDAYKARLATQNDADARTVELVKREVDVEQREQELKAQILIADGEHWYTACIRPFFAFPFIAYNIKLIVWDKMFGLGVTDPLSPDLLKLEMIVVGFYFLGRSGEKITRMLTRKRTT